MIAICNLCRFPVVRIDRTLRAARCVRCRSTLVHRAMGLAIDELGLGPEARVYELSSRGALHRHLSRRFRHFYCSEFFPDIPPGEKRGDVVCQDVERLLLPDRSFDLVTSTEVFEHVPDDRQGFREVHRVLDAGGRFVFTVPLGDETATQERCRRALDGTIEHLLSPQYHGDRIRGEGEVLVFRNYGMDLFDRLAECGFRARLAKYRVPRHAVPEQKVVIADKV